MKQEKELQQRYANVSLLVNATELTIAKPIDSVADNLKKGDARSKALGAALIAGGAGAAGVAATSMATIGTATAVTTFGITAGGGMAAGATAAALGGPIVWIAVGTGALGGIVIKKLVKRSKEKKAAKEKESLLKSIIAKQQAIINKLSRQNELNAQEIRNLKEALQMMRDAEQQVNNNFSFA